MKHLSNRTAIVTGASQGLGVTICREFLDQDANVVMCARDESLLKSVAAELAPHAGPGRSLSFIKADVSSEDDVDKLVSFAIQKHGQVDALINNAGVYGPKGLIEDVDWREWTKAMEVNLYGPVLTMRALFKHFRRNSYGKVVNLSGGGATAPLPRLSAYAASKAAIVRLTETFAHEVAGTGIDVNAIAPGALNTRLLDEILEAGPEAVGEHFFARSIKQKEDGGASLEKAAQLCVYLSSAASDGITGRLISAVWDPWSDLQQYRAELEKSEIYTLRRIVPADRGATWG